jgi:hypothetical protein
LKLNLASEKNFVKNLDERTREVNGLLNEYRLLVEIMSNTLYALREQAADQEVSNIICDFCPATETCPYYSDREDISGFEEGPKYCTFYISENMNLGKVLDDIEKRNLHDYRNS